MKINKKGFTLIELIIVIVIVGILAVVAIPKYFANIEKARKAEAVSTMRSIREAILGYFSVNGGYPSGFPIEVTVDGDIVMTVAQPISSNFTYSYDATTVTAAKRGSTQKTYTMNIASGEITET